LFSFSGLASDVTPRRFWREGLLIGIALCYTVGRMGEEVVLGSLLKFSELRDSDSELEIT
jgi:hypothetical protein